MDDVEALLEAPLRKSSSDGLPPPPPPDDDMELQMRERARAKYKNRADREKELNGHSLPPPLDPDSPHGSSTRRRRRTRSRSVESRDSKRSGHKSSHSHHSSSRRDRDRDRDRDVDLDREERRRKRREREKERDGDVVMDLDDPDEERRRRRRDRERRDRDRDRRDKDPVIVDGIDDLPRDHPREPPPPRRRRRDERDRDDDHYDRMDRERERERRRARSRSRSRERRERFEDAHEKDREGRRGRGRYDDLHEGDTRKRRRRRSPSYDNYHEGEKSPSPPGPKLSEEEHEMRSVFVSQLSARVGDRELSFFFEQNAGQVRDAKVITDRISRRSKGVGYVEFLDVSSVPKAISLTGTKLLGIPVVVQFTEAEKNRQAMQGNLAALNPPSASSGNLMNPNISNGMNMNQNNPDDPSSSASSSSSSFNRLYVGSLNFNLTDADIRSVFQPFGPVEFVDLHRDQVTGKSKGYAFVQFKRPEDAKQAMEKMNGFPLAGRQIKVGHVTEKGATAATGPTGGAVFKDPSSLDEGTGGNLNSISRIELMQKLARTDRPLELPKVPLYRPNIPVATSKAVLMKNAFNAEEETERDWDLELGEDVKTECEAKYGPIVEIYVDKESTQGEIYLRFDDVNHASAAIEGLNGRWFGGRQIQANFVSEAFFEASKRR